MHSKELLDIWNATVLTNIPIKDNQLFEVELLEMIEKWHGSLSIGFTAHAPDRIEFPKDMTYMTSGTWMICGKEVIHCKQTTKLLGYDINDLVVSIDVRIQVFG